MKYKYSAKIRGRSEEFWGCDKMQIVTDYLSFDRSYLRGDVGIEQRLERMADLFAMLANELSIDLTKLIDPRLLNYEYNAEPDTD
jgi:hypothetical protein